MKKINIEKHEKMLKAMAPNYFETIVILVSLVLTTLAIDLKLETMAKVCSSIFLAFFMYCLCWTCHALFIAIVKNRREKQNKSVDVPKTEEVNKENEN